MTGRDLPLVARAHPFTGPSVTVAVTLLAFLLPAPSGPVLLYAAVLGAVMLLGSGRAVWQGALVCLPLWLFLLVLHGLLGDRSTGTWTMGPVLLSAEGTRVALAQSARLGAIVTATLAMYRGFIPARFLDAAAQRGWSFQTGYLVVATITAVPGFVAQVKRVREAQRARGLRTSGGWASRGKGLRALALPLVFGAMAEVEERALVLETRATRGAARRTALEEPADTVADRTVRWMVWAAVLAALAWRIQTWL